MRWYITDPVSGRRSQRQITVRGTERDARRAMRDAQDAEFVPTTMTVAELVEQWLALPTSKRSRTRQEQSSLFETHIRPNLGHVKASALTPAQIMALYSRLAGFGYSAQTIRHIHNLLNPAYKLAVDMDWLERNPCRACRVPEIVKAPIQAPRTEDVMAALTACPPELRCFAVLAAITGARRGEIAGLQWGDVDWDRGVLTIRRSVSELRGGGPLEVNLPKTGKARKVAIDDVARAALTEQSTRHLAHGFQGRPGDYVFASPTCIDGDKPTRPHRFTQAWRTACKTAGVAIRFHDLRHWHASVLLMDGHDIKSVSARLGHSRASTTLDVYGHILEDRGLVMAQTASKALDAGRKMQP